MKRKTRPRGERPVGAPVPGGTPQDFRLRSQEGKQHRVSDAKEERSVTMAETYESIRDHEEIIPPGVRETWIKADQSERMLRWEHERLTQDQDLTDEARARRAGELYEKHRPLIERRKKEAKDALVKAAKSAEKSSIPRPDGEALSSTDPTKLLLDQNEASRILRTIERRKSQSGPFRPSTDDLLRQVYSRGIEFGGTEGGAVCRGVLRASRELGIGGNWLDSVRNDNQRKSLDNARRLEHYSGLISTSAPEPPKSLKKAAKRGAVRYRPPLQSWCRAPIRSVWNLAPPRELLRSGGRRTPLERVSGMATKCKVCGSMEAYTVDRFLVIPAGTPGKRGPRSLAPVFGVDRRDIARHDRVCLVGERRQQVLAGLMGGGV